MICKVIQMPGRNLSDFMGDDSPSVAVSATSAGLPDEGYQCDFLAGEDPADNWARYCHRYDISRTRREVGDLLIMRELERPAFAYLRDTWLAVSPSTMERDGFLRKVPNDIVTRLRFIAKMPDEAAEHIMEIHERSLHEYGPVTGKKGKVIWKGAHRPPGGRV